MEINKFLSSEKEKYKNRVKQDVILSFTGALNYDKQSMEHRSLMKYIPFYIEIIEKLLSKEGIDDDWFKETKKSYEIKS